MPNPFGSIGSIPVMSVVQDMLQRQATIRNQQILGDEREQLIKIRAQEMQERQATMKALQQDLQGGIQAQIDKTTIPSEDDSAIGLAQKNVRSLQQQFDTTNQRAMAVANAGGSPEFAMQLRREADGLQSRLIQANRELRLEQRNQARMMGESAGAIAPDGSNFDQVMNDLRTQDPRIDRKYTWDRDVDGKPVYGDTSRRTLNTIAQASMTAKDQVEQRLKLDKAAQDVQDRELKRKKEEEEIKRIDSQTALNNARRDKLLAPKPAAEDKPSKSADRLQAIADKAPTKDAVNGARAAIRNEFKGEFDDSIDTLAQSVAAKTNELRANAAKRGEELDMDDARSQAIDLIRPYVKSTEQGWTDPIFGYHFGSGTKLSFNRAATPLPKAEPPKAGSDADLLKRLNAVGLEIGITNGKVNGKGGPGNPVQLSKDSGRADVQYEALPSGTEFVGPDGQKRTKP